MKKLPHMILLLVFLLVSAGIVPAAGQEEPGQPLGPSSDPNTKHVYLPITMNGLIGFGVSGQVTDDLGNPLGGVEVSNGAGLSATTGDDGAYHLDVPGDPKEYSFSPAKQDIGFAPTLVDLEIDGNVSNLDFVGMSECSELVVNGDFETASVWDLQNAFYDSEMFNGGKQSLRLGNQDPYVNPASSSTAISSLINIPGDAKQATLRLWLFPKSISTASSNPSVAEPGENFYGPATDANDIQAIDLLTANGATLKTLWEKNGSNNQNWSLLQFSLLDYVNQSVKLGFRVVNDGNGNATSLYVDDVSLSTCPTIYSPEEYTNETLSPDAPEACANQMVNSGFETAGGWGIPYTAYPARYTDLVKYSGSRSMQTGIVYAYNRYSYSDAWQTVYIPTTASSANLNMYVKMYSTEAPLGNEQPDDNHLAESDPHFATGATWGDSPLAYDAMYILILNPYTGAIRQTLRTWTARNNDWKLQTFDLTAYRGQSIRIQFGTYNDGYGGVTAMFADDVRVDVCDGSLPPPPPSLTCPTGYSERLLNNSFENSNGWYIPVTAYSARYSGLLHKTGVRSMQTGITNPWHNRYSYSDFGQYTAIPGFVSSAVLKFWVYRQSNDWYGSDKQYLLVLDNWGNWIDTLLWNTSVNYASWTEIPINVTYLRGLPFPIRLQFGTYNNGWNGVTSMFVDDVTLCTYP
jgi:hypothetical protein